MCKGSEPGPPQILKSMDAQNIKSVIFADNLHTPAITFLYS